MKSAMLRHLKLKLMANESSEHSTACQIPAGWYKKSPSVRVTSSQFASNSSRLYSSSVWSLISLIYSSKLPEFLKCGVKPQRGDETSLFSSFHFLVPLS